MRFTCGLCGSLCTLQLFRSTKKNSFASYVAATLDMGWRLAFAQQGLSPYKRKKTYKRRTCMAHQRLRNLRADFASQ